MTSALRCQNPHCDEALTGDEIEADRRLCRPCHLAFWIGLSVGGTLALGVGVLTWLMGVCNSIC